MPATSIGGEAWTRAYSEVDRDRLVETATQDDRRAQLHRRRAADGRADGELYEDMGLQTQWHQVEDNRANALGTGAAPAAGSR